MTISKFSFLNELVVSIIKLYNHRLYWYMRKKVVEESSNSLCIIKLFYLLIIKFVDEYHGAFIGTGVGYGAKFTSPPNLPHGLNGIVIHQDAKFGANVTIQHQVTFAGETDSNGNSVAPTCGDNCLFGSGAKIIGNVVIGDNVKVGANAVVVHDLPSFCTAVGVPAKVIIKTKD